MIGFAQSRRVAFVPRKAGDLGRHNTNNRYILRRSINTVIVETKRGYYGAVCLRLQALHDAQISLQHNNDLPSMSHNLYQHRNQATTTRDGECLAGFSIGRLDLTAKLRKFSRRLPPIASRKHAAIIKFCSRTPLRKSHTSLKVFGSTQP